MKPICPRCGEEERCVEVTTWGDRGLKFIGLGCDCPGPRCPFSGGRLDHAGRCSDSECFMWHEVIPIPVVA